MKKQNFFILIMLCLCFEILPDNSSDFKKFISACSLLNADEINIFVTKESLTRNERKQLKLRFDYPLWDYWKDSTANLWDQLICADKSGTITLYDLKRLFNNPGPEALRDLVTGREIMANLVCTGNSFYMVKQGEGLENYFTDLSNSHSVRMPGGFRLFRASGKLFLVIIDFNQWGFAYEKAFLVDNNRRNTFEKKYEAGKITDIFYDTTTSRYTGRIINNNSEYLYVDILSGEELTGMYREPVSGKPSNLVQKSDGGYINLKTGQVPDFEEILFIDYGMNMAVIRKGEEKALADLDNFYKRSSWFKDISHNKRYIIKNKACYMVMARDMTCGFLDITGFAVISSGFKYRIADDRIYNVKNQKSYLVRYPDKREAFLSQEEGTIITPLYNFRFVDAKIFSDADSPNCLVKNSKGQVALFSLVELRLITPWYGSINPVNHLFKGTVCLLAESNRKQVLISALSGKEVSGQYREIAALGYSFKGYNALLVTAENGSTAFLSLTSGKIISDCYHEILNKEDFSNSDPPGYYLVSDLKGNIMVLSKLNGSIIDKNIIDVFPFDQTIRDAECFLVIAGDQQYFVSRQDWQYLTDKYAVINREPFLFKGKSSLLVTTLDKCMAFLSTSTGSLDSALYHMIGKEIYTAGNKQYLQVCNKNKQWGFILMDSETLLGDWYTDISERNSKFAGDSCFRVTNSRGEQAFFSRPKGELVSGWYGRISADLFSFRGLECYIVQSSDLGAFFIDSHTGHPACTAYLEIEEKAYLIESNIYYMVTDQGKKRKLISGRDGKPAADTIIDMFGKQEIQPGRKD